METVIYLMYTILDTMVDVMTNPVKTAIFLAKTCTPTVASYAVSKVALKKFNGIASDNQLEALNPEKLPKTLVITATSGLTTGVISYLAYTALGFTSLITGFAIAPPISFSVLSAAGLIGIMAKSQTPYLIAQKFKRQIEIRNELDDDHEKIKLFGHIFGLKNEIKIKIESDTRDVPLEGMKKEESLTHLEKYVSSFFKEDSISLSNADKKHILEAIKRGFPNITNKKELLKRAESGSPCIIMGGSKHHVVGMVIHGNRLYICNRGLGRKEQAVEVYQWKVDKAKPKESQKKLKEIIHKLTIRYGSDSSKSCAEIKEDFQRFDDMIKSLNLECIDEGWDQKDQGSGNCVWASGKGVVGILFSLFNQDSAYQNYKSFTSFTRWKALVETIPLKTKYQGQGFEKCWNEQLIKLQSKRSYYQPPAALISKSTIAKYRASALSS